MYISYYLGTRYVLRTLQSFAKETVTSHPMIKSKTWGKVFKSYRKGFNATAFSNNFIIYSIQSFHSFRKSQT